MGSNTVYKVVIQNHKGRFLSRVAHKYPSICVEYKIGEKSVGREGTPLFAFSSLNSASQFAVEYKMSRILKCNYEPYTGEIQTAEKLHEINSDYRQYLADSAVLRVNRNFGIKAIRRFWKNLSVYYKEYIAIGGKRFGIGTVPQNTVLCDSITPFEVLDGTYFHWEENYV